MTMKTLEEFSENRPFLFSIAYRMLGSVADAEDMVQETYLRWQTVEEEVKSPKAYLATMITRLCINHLESARVKREEYVGPWLPEPLVLEDPTKHAALADSLSVAFLLLLEKLSPVERAVFLLREVFDFEYEQISEITGKNEDNCRQLMRRAKQKLASRQNSNATVHRAETGELLNKFLQACATGDVHVLVSVLEKDITLYSDGGGKVAAALRPIHGPDHVARFLIGVLKKFEPSAFTYRNANVNGKPGILIYHHNQLNSVLTIESGETAISSIYIVSNPDKIDHLT